MMASTDRATSFLRPAASRPRLEPLESRLPQHTSSSWRKASSRRAGTPDLCFACASTGAPVTARRQAGVKNGSSIGARATAPRVVRTADRDRGPADRLSPRRYCSCPFPEPGLAARSDDSPDGAWSAQPALSGPPPHQCTEATIALPHQAPCCSKTFPVTRGKLGAGRGLWARIMIALSCAAACPASEHVCWHNSC